MRVSSLGWVLKLKKLGKQQHKLEQRYGNNVEFFGAWVLESVQERELEMKTETGTRRCRILVCVPWSGAGISSLQEESSVPTLTGATK